MNTTAFNKLDTKKVVYNAEIHGKFSETSYPLPEKLQLRVGAQVMFIKNDSNPEKRYYNGKIGKIISINNTDLVVKCKDEEITVTTETWENTSYTLNAETKEIESKVAGTYTQIPLKLAWAITIHKSQGMSIDNLVCNVDNIFAPSQFYVAISRAVNPKNLKVDFNKGDLTQYLRRVVHVDERVVEYYKRLIV